MFYFHLCILVKHLVLRVLCVHSPHLKLIVNPLHKVSSCVSGENTKSSIDTGRRLRKLSLAAMLVSMSSQL
jgi:hypothetical protein